MMRKRPKLTPAIIALALVFASGLSLAHSSKEATEPADGAVIAASPKVIAMRFDEPMRITKITVTDSNGKDFDLARNDDLKPLKRFEAVPETLSPGRYTVEWRGLASDGHAMSGSFSFQVGD